MKGKRMIGLLAFCKRKCETNQIMRLEVKCPKGW